MRSFRLLLLVLFSLVRPNVASGQDGVFRGGVRYDSLRLETAMVSSQIDSAAQVAGWEPLRRSTVPPGRYELRLTSTTSSFDLAAPRPLLRLVSERGRTTGELLMVWKRRPILTTAGVDSVPTPERLRAEGYVEPGRSGSWIVCRVRFTEPPSWDCVLSAFERLGISELPSDWMLSPPNITIAPTHSEDILIESLRGDRYGAARYSAPSLEEGPGYRRALEAEELLQTVFRSRKTARLACPAA